MGEVVGRKRLKLRSEEVKDQSVGESHREGCETSAIGARSDLSENQVLSLLLDLLVDTSRFRDLLRKYVDELSSRIEVLDREIQRLEEERRKYVVLRDRLIGLIKFLEHYDGDSGEVGVPEE
ncbi:MAG: hypothetical protein DRJ40_02115 [Thermoprotei archaeon]|nr:MAG: hypothetical protein DRJ40_02115 [Thermoprotei archaeon]